MMAIAVAALTFTSCDDVPMPYNEPNITPAEPTVDVEPAGSGTAADPYNVAAILKQIEALTDDNTTETVYVKGTVSQIVNIETEQYGNANYYITDAGSNNKVYIFQSYYLGNRKFTASDKLEVGDVVVICGKFYNYGGSTPETVGKGSSYIYSLNGKTSEGSDPTPSTEAKGDGTQANPYNVAGAIAKAATLSSSDKLENVYVSGIVSSIKEVDTGTYGNATYYISEDGTTGTQFCIYRGYYLNGDKFTSADQLKVGQKVVVYGNLINYYGNTPEMAQGNKIISIDGSGSETPETPETPTTSEYLSISGTTVTITNTGATAGDETVTVDFNAQGWNSGDAATDITLSDGTKIMFAANGNTNAPKYFTATKGLRVYMNNIIKFSGVKKIAKIVMTCDAYNGTNYVGNAAAAVAIDGNDITYTNSDPSITSGGGVQLRVQKLTITYAK